MSQLTAVPGWFRSVQFPNLLHVREEQFKLGMFCSYPLDYLQQQSSVALSRGENSRGIITFLSHLSDFPARYQVEIDDESWQGIENKWRKRVRVERTGDIRDAARRF